MKTENAVLTQQARAALEGKWGLAVGAFALYMIIVLAIQGLSQVSGFMALVSLIIAGPFAAGIAIFSLAIARNLPARINQIFEGFNNFGTTLGAYLLMLLFIILWMLLLIVPGIIAAISYSQTFFILADTPSLGAMEAIDKSKRMMDGYKWKYFCLGLRFLGWALLCILTLGIGFLFLIPYMQVSFARFFDDIKESPSAVTDAQL